MTGSVAVIAVASLGLIMPGGLAADTLALAEAPLAGQPNEGGAAMPRATPSPQIVGAIAPRPLPRIVSGTERDAAGSPGARPDAFGVIGRTRDGHEFAAPVDPAIQGALDLPFPPAVPAPDRDGLLRVADASVYPDRAAGMLVAQFGGLAGYCSAALVGPSTVLTAAHCIHDHAMGWADEIMFFPGLNGEDTAPFGGWRYDAAHVVAGFLTEYTGSYAAVVGYDLAVVTLEAPVGNWLGWFGFGADPDGGALVRLRAYPGDRPFGTMWQSDCALSLSPRLWPSAAPTVTPSVALHDCPVAHGSSGGGMGGPETTLHAVTVAISPEGSLAVALGPLQVAWVRGLWQ